MCGRDRRRGDKQEIAEAFHVKGGIEDADFGEDLDAAPGSVQPVILASDQGERDFVMMRWGFKLPDRLLFNARSEGSQRRISERKCFSSIGESSRRPHFSSVKRSAKAIRTNTKSPFPVGSYSEWLASDFRRYEASAGSELRYASGRRICASVMLPTVMLIVSSRLGAI
jgi:hypothetical protein